MSMVKYTDNKQLKSELTKLLIDKDVKFTEIAKELGVSKQYISNLFNKKNLSFTDISNILNAFGYDLCFDFMPQADCEEKIAKLKEK